MGDSGLFYISTNQGLVIVLHNLVVLFDREADLNEWQK